MARTPWLVWWESELDGQTMCEDCGDEREALYLAGALRCGGRMRVRVTWYGLAIDHGTEFVNRRDLEEWATRAERLRADDSPYQAVRPLPRSPDDVPMCPGPGSGRTVGELRAELRAAGLL